MDPLNESTTLPGGLVVRYSDDEMELLATRAPFRRRRGECDRCDCTETLASHDDEYLCQDCWHQTRRETQGYGVYNIATGYPVGFQGTPMTTTLWHAILMLADRANRGRDKYEIRECGWSGERVAHPSYGDRRRGALLAAHPEYASAPGSTE